MKSFVISFSLAASLFAASANAHTRVWSVWVNGVDQGTGVAIRDPLYNGPPLAGNNPFGQGSGYSNWPYKNIEHIDYRCGALGDIQDPNTIDVAPGDIVTHHESREASDDIIASSHHGPCVVYITPDPPTDNSWVKIQEEGEYGPNKWCSTGSLVQAKGKLNTRIPAGLAPGKYLLRPELVTLHEAEVVWPASPGRGAQLYVECIQINVTGSGTVKLPSGVSIPGAYSYDDPGIHYNVYYTSPGAPPYKIPGPTVWSGAYPSPSPPAFGSPKGPLTAERWSSWLKGDTTSVVISSGAAGLVTRTHIPSWSTTYNTPTAPATTSAAPSSTPTGVATTTAPPSSSRTTTSSSVRSTTTSATTGTVPKAST
ncbi:hypothetical protein FRC02_003885 [Tulasnella sp. 418]|nr:hypothetical protein FRC02_003885 [Tulasnella sp. 418]